MSDDKREDQPDDELVAYLDGELDPEQSAIVERRLSEETDYRLRLAQLQRAFDLLEQLPRADVEESFTRSTMELVVVAETEQLQQQQVQQPQRIWNWVLMATCLICASLATYLFVSTATASQNRRLVEDLPVIEDFDLYRYADNMDFLRMLDSQGLFAVEERDDELQ